MKADRTPGDLLRASVRLRSLGTDQFEDTLLMLGYRRRDSAAPAADPVAQPAVRPTTPPPSMGPPVDRPLAVVPRRSTTRRVLDRIGHRWALLPVVVFVALVGAAFFAIPSLFLGLPVLVVAVVWLVARAFVRWDRSDVHRSKADRSDASEDLADTIDVELRPSSARPDPQPLLSFHGPNGRRGLGVLLLRTTIDEGAPDVERTVELLAQSTPLARLPTMQRRATTGGWVVLVDRGPAMVPFLADASVLGDELLRLGRSTGRVLSFVASPLWGVGPTVLDIEPFSARHLPARGGRVLVLSDLGTGRPPRASSRSTPSTWLHFDDVCRTAGVRPLYLCPYPRRRLAARLHRLPVLRWDRALRTSEIERQAR